MSRSFTLLTICATLLLSSICGASSAPDKETLRRLLEDYETYGLPLPPADATLALLPSPSSTAINGVWSRDMHLVLLLQQASGKKAAVYWIGCDEGPHWHSTEFKPVAPKRESLTNTAPVPGDLRSKGFPTYPDLALAVQCFARGWDELAASLLARSQQKPPEGSRRRRTSPRPSDDRAALAQLAWNHYCNEFVEKKSERRERRSIVAGMKKVLASPHGLNTEARRNVLTDMEKTLVEVKTAPGSLEAAVEGLLDLKDRDSSWPGTGWRDLRNYSHWNSNYKKLRDQGLLAVPVLIKHVNDYRLTPTMATKSDGSYTWHIRIADVVARLLNDLAPEPFTYDFLEKEGRGMSLDRDHVESWWREVRGQKELDFLVSGIYRQREESTRAEPNEAVLHVLGSRFPLELVKLFEQEFRKGKADYVWFRALAESKAPAETKSRLFLAAAKSKDEWSQVLALRELVPPKHPDAVPLLVKSLEAQPKTPDKEYWTGNIGNFAQIVIGTPDQRAWDALLKTARRVDVGQRMEILNAFSRCQGGTKDPFSIRFLLALLDDKGIRDNDSSKLFDGPGAAFSQKRIAVRDYAAQQLAWVLGTRDDWNPARTEADWRKLRERAAAEAAKVKDSGKKEKRK